MKLKNLFNVILFSFIMIVPLIPMKFKIWFIPMSADFLLGGALIIVGLFCIIKKYLNKEKIFEPFNNKSIKILSVVIALFTLLSLFSITYASNKTAAISETMRFLQYVLMFYFIIIILDENTIDRCLEVFYLTMMFASIFGVAQLLFNWSTLYTADGLFNTCRISSTFVNPNYWGAAVNLVIFYPLIKLIDGKSTNKKVDIFAFCLFLFNLLFSSTRGSWIGFVIGIVLLCLIRYRSKIHYFIGIIISGIVAMLIIPSTRTRFFGLFTVKERFSLWKTGYYMFRDNFWKGVGNGNYLTKYESYIKKYKSLDLNRTQFSVHNSYIKMFAELGIFGGILFILTYIGIFNLIFRVYKETKKYEIVALSFLAFGGAYLTQNLSNDLVFIPQLNVFVWIIGALLFKGLYIEKRGE